MRANRAYLRRRGIKATIPSKADQDAHRRKRGSKGGRPPSFDPEIYKQRHAVECGINRLKRGQDDDRVPILWAAPQPVALVGLPGECTGVDVAGLLDIEEAGWMMVDRMYQLGTGS